jgi:uncharacterized membrane protein
MLLVMIMNIWIIVAVLLGHFVGFLAATMILHKMKSRSATISGKEDLAQQGPCDGDCC